MIKQSGNSTVQELPISPTVGMNEMSVQMRAEGEKVSCLGFGQSPFPVPGHVVDALKDHAAKKDYLPVKGLMDLRKQIAIFLETKTGVHYSTDNILVGPGSKELMFAMQMACNSTLVLPAPSWVSYAPQAHIIGRETLWIETSKEDNFMLTAEGLEKGIKNQADRPMILVLNYPNNPTGRTFSANELEAIAKVCRKYGLIVLSDEIYSETTFDGIHTSIAGFYPEGTIISNGLSKWCGAGGWRLGCFAIPEELSWLAENMTVIGSETFTTTSAPIQYAAIEGFKESGNMSSYLFHQKRVLKAVAEYCYNTLTDGGIGSTKPQGGFYMVIDLNNFRGALEDQGIKTSADLFQTVLKKTGVALLPASGFGRKPYEFMARLAYVDFDGEKALVASGENQNGELTDAFVKEWCPDLAWGVNKLVEWCGSL